MPALASTGGVLALALEKIAGTSGALNHNSSEVLYRLQRALESCPASVNRNRDIP